MSFTSITPSKSLWGPVWVATGQYVTSQVARRLISLQRVNSKLQCPQTKEVTQANTVKGDVKDRKKRKADVKPFATEPFLSHNQSYKSSSANNGKGM